MIPITTATIMDAFLVFCRVGCCLMLMPGFSNTRISMQMRLFLAIAISLALTPLISGTSPVTSTAISASALMALVFSECAFGALIGFLGRCFFLALQFMTVAITSFAGLGTMPGAPTIDTEPLSSLASLIMMIATLLLFVTDQHLEILRALVGTYHAVPLASTFGPEVSLDRISEVMTRSFALALQISGPFVVYTVIVNVLFGLVNKMTPQIPVYFVSLPFVIAGGLFLAYFAIAEALPIFLNDFSRWLIGR